MAITYPLTFPTEAKIVSVDLRLVRSVAVTESPFTMQQQTFIHQGSKWTANVKLAPVKGNDAKAVQAFFTSLQGRAGTFLLCPTSLTSDLTGITLSGAASTGDTSITVGGTGSLYAGDVFQIGTGADSRLHQVVESATLDGSEVITFEPPLRKAYANGTPLNFDQPSGLWRLVANDVGWNAGTATIHEFSFACEEVII